MNLTIRPGMKVAICGRSGRYTLDHPLLAGDNRLINNSGKSSLLGTLLRCLDLTSGTVIIDGQDITRVSRDSLRKRFMTLPQKALFINASIRENMTLWDEDSSRPQEYTDALIESALKRVGIWDALFTRKTSKKVEPSSDLEVSASDSEIDIKEPDAVTLESNLDPEERLSIGQQQLFCLARALFQQSSSQIVLMDEFTSSMDHETEMLVRKIIKQDLKQKTVIEVIHRLQHILDFDLVVVVDKGRIAESGHPADLLRKETGLLRELYLAANT